MLRPCGRRPVLDYYTSGLFTPGTAMLQPAMYVRGLAQALGSNRGSRLRELAGDGAGARGRRLAREHPVGSITAPRIILAVNGLINDFGFFKGRLMHVFTYGSMTRAMTAEEVARLGGDPIWHLTPADPVGTTVRRISGTGGNRLIVRNRFSFDPGKEVPERRFANIARDHDRVFRARFPNLAGMEMEYRWGGRRCLSPNNVGAFGEVARAVLRLLSERAWRSQRHHARHGGGGVGSRSANRTRRLPAD